VTLVELVPAAPEQKSILANLIELYAHDFSEFHALELGPDGRFGYADLPLYWSDPGRHPFLITVEGKLAGLALVCRREDAWDVAEFFIVRAYRRRGIGSEAGASTVEQVHGAVGSARDAVEFRRSEFLAGRRSDIYRCSDPARGDRTRGRAMVRVSIRARGAGRLLDFGIELEEGIEGLLELAADFLFAAFNEMHGDVRGVAVLELDGGVGQLLDFIGRDQAQAVDQSEFCHTSRVRSLLLENLLDVELALLGQSEMGRDGEGFGVGGEGPDLAGFELRALDLLGALDHQVVAGPEGGALAFAVGHFVDALLAVGGVLQVGGGFTLGGFLNRGHGEVDALMLDLAGDGYGGWKGSVLALSEVEFPVAG
jgi:hypothetical protein